MAPSSPHSQLSIADCMHREAIKLALESNDRHGVLRELVGLVPGLKQRSAESQQLLDALIEREEMHSTGIGDGLALPHTRNTVGGLVQEPLIVFGRHPNGIHYGAIDGKPVVLFFLLLTTSITEHLHVLARMSRLLRDPSLRSDLIMTQNPPDVISRMRQAER